MLLFYMSLKYKIVNDCSQTIVKKFNAIED